MEEGSGEFNQQVTDAVVPVNVVNAEEGRPLASHIIKFPSTPEEITAFKKTWTTCKNVCTYLKTVIIIALLASFITGIVYTIKYQHTSSTFPAQIIQLATFGQIQNLHGVNRTCFAYQCGLVTYSEHKPDPVCYYDQYERLPPVFVGQYVQIYKPGIDIIDGQSVCSRYRTTVPRSWHVIGKYLSIISALLLICMIFALCDENNITFIINHAAVEMHPEFFKVA